MSASIADLRSSPNLDLSMIAQGEQQLALVISMKRQLATAAPAQVASLSAEISSLVSAVASTARQAQQASSGGAGSGSNTLSNASQLAKQAVNGFEEAYFKDKKFDAYLEFKSAEDERAFREREAKRKQDIEDALALGTPEGNLRASELSLAQMHDAGAHGADHSPDFEPTLTKLEKATEQLKSEISKAHQQSAAPEQPPLDPAAAAPPEVAVVVPKDLLAKFQAAGVTVPDQQGTGHGVNVASTAQGRGASQSL